MKSDAQRKAENKYRRDKLHVVTIKYTKEEYNRVSEAARNAEEHVTTYIRNAVTDRMNAERQGSSTENPSAPDPDPDPDHREHP